MNSMHLALSLLPGTSMYSQQQYVPPPRGPVVMHS
jgi:hypothetical protein